MTTQIRRISNSEIQTFKECRRKWWLAWHRGLTSARVSPLGALAVGTRIHAALASFYVPDFEPLTDPRDELLRLLEDDWRALQDSYEGLVPTDVKKDFDSEAELQKIMLDGYMEWLTDSGTDETYEVIASESYVEAPFFDVPNRDIAVHLIGRLDVRVRRIRDGKIMFVDHKTAASILNLLKILPLNEQMKMYRLLLALSEGENEQVGGAVYNILRKVKRSKTARPPFYHRETVNFNPIELRNFKTALRGVIADILMAEQSLAIGTQHHNVVYPTPTTDCSWKCQFNKICHMFDDGSRVEDAISDNYVVTNPLTYYGKDDLDRHSNS